MYFVTEALKFSRKFGILLNYVQTEHANSGVCDLKKNLMMNYKNITIKLRHVVFKFIAVFLDILLKMQGFRISIASMIFL